MIDTSSTPVAEPSRSRNPVATSRVAHPPIAPTAEQWQALSPAARESPEIQTRIMSCPDIAHLEHWLDRAATVSSMEDLFS